MEAEYIVDISGYVKHLPIVEIGVGVNVAFLNLHGDVELTEHCAKKLAMLAKHADVVITAESKGLQLAHCLARNLGNSRYVVARKALKQYMKDGIFVTVKSITTQAVQTLYISKDDANYISGKRVIIVDDVISTGNSLDALESIIEKANGVVVQRLFVLAEGDAQKRTDIEFLAKIPLF
ncbi:MAG: adenine phosphoribosyltransferase [Christensenellaceae bacterium]|jgi:adenine phosphoribosyltransferase|nr:adenine phosphoribosyltransferase [Christensenellaceae bacterium]